MSSSSAMKKRSCSCSVRLIICLLVGVAVCGLITISGWPSALYSGYSEESAQTQLQDEVEKFVEPKAHSHKHYHRHSGTPTLAVRPVSTLSSESTEQPVVSDLQRGDGAPSASQTEKEDESQEITDPKLNEYKTKVLTAQDEALYVLSSNTGWKYAKGTSRETDGMVYYMQTSKWGKIYKLEAILDVNAELLFEDIVYKSEKVPEWNPTMMKVKVLQPIDDSTEIAYSISASAAGGIVSSRHWEEEDGWLVTSSISIVYDKMPPNKLYVRGEQKPGIIRMRNTKDNKAELQWVLNSDIKGWIPSSVVESAMSGTLITYLKSLRAHASSLR